MSGSIRWLGHSTVVIELDGTRLVTDPALRQRVMHLRRDAAVEAPPEVDAILLSHLHYDHLDLPSLARIGTATPVFVPLGGAKWLRRFEQVTEVEPGQELELAGLRARVVAARHDGRRRNYGPTVPAVGYVVEGSTSIYFAGDTGLFDGMRDVAPIDVALIPVAGWGPNVDEGHLDPTRAAEALTMLHPRIAVPIHWGTYRIIGKPLRLEPPDEFAAAAHEVAPEVDVRILPLGGSLEL